MNRLTSPSLRRPTRVVSRSSSVARPVRDIAREFGVEGMLEGSITRAGERAHVTRTPKRANGGGKESVKNR
jgi:hypothetical protein